MILVVNPGSSSIKFQLFETNHAQPISILEGIAERIGVDGNLVMKFQGQKHQWKVMMPDHLTAVSEINAHMLELQVIKDKKEIQGIGFRVVHGGDKLVHPIIIDEQVKKGIEDNFKLAPLHNPPALVAINAFEKQFHLPMVAVFDTAFHQTLDPVNYLYPVPYTWYKENKVRKYGFHGISYEYITTHMSQVLNIPQDKLNLIVCHLGSGASITAIKNGQSLDTSMGFTPLAGLMMGTRSGDIDASIVQYMVKETGLDAFQITDILNKQAGLLGMAGMSDMRDVTDAVRRQEELPTLAWHKYCRVVARYLVDYANQLAGKIDAIIFTAGVGENSKSTRKEIIKHVKLLNLTIDETANEAKYDDYQLISTAQSAYPIYCVRTNEELMICHHTLKLVQ
ncbi:acetate kinase [Williamsoniiplasma lucivorax]|uniref:Acetate kinase n=1 Tax=Williamsoniiplasma lucivorax TaxID=209274 RepID=A0A2S5R9W3_9MOLU|nr:acetate kinase [Williamsoniiplasma lucivorax]PPE04119.1 acetate kinase [Williamsoniiplasma lucivorax]